MSMCSVHAAQWVPVWTCRVCAFCVHMWTMWLWLKGGTAKAPSGSLYPVIFPSSARALNGEGGSVTSLPHTLEGGNLLTKVSAKGVAEVIHPPSKTYPSPAAPNSAPQFIRHRSEPFNWVFQFLLLGNTNTKNPKTKPKNLFFIWNHGGHPKWWFTETMVEETLYPLTAANKFKR